MAGVEVPTLRDEGPAPEGLAPKLSVDNLPNAEPDLRAQRQGFENIADATVRLMQKTEHDTAFTMGTAAANHLQMTHDGAIEQIEGMEGANPHDSFKNYDESLKQAFDKVANDPTYDSFTRGIVNKMAQRKFNQLHHQRLMKEGNMQRKYDDGINDSQAYLLRQSVVESGGDVDLTKDDSFGTTHDFIRQIENNRVIQALRNGGAYQSENGNFAYTDPSTNKLMRVQASPQTLMAIHKDASEGLNTMVQNLANSGKLDEAEAAKEEFKQYLTGKVGTLDHKIKTERDLEESSSLALKAAAEPDPEKRQIILAKASSSKVQLMATRYSGGIVGSFERQKNIESHQNLNEASKGLIGWQESENPPNSVEEVLMNPKYKPLLDKMSAEDRKKFEKSVVRPDVSSKGALSRVQELKDGTLTMSGPDGNPIKVDVKNLTFAQQSQIFTGLNSQDAQITKSFISKANSNPAMLGNYRLASKEFQDYGWGKLWTGDNPFSPNQLIKGRSQWSAMQTYKGQLDEELNHHDFSSPSEVTKFVRSWINQKVSKGGGGSAEDEANNPAAQIDKNAPVQLHGSAIVTAPAGNAPKMIDVVTPAIRVQARKDWAKQNGVDSGPQKREATTSELNQWFKDNFKKYGLSKDFKL